MVFNNYFATHSLYSIYPISTANSLLCILFLYYFLFFHGLLWIIFLKEWRIDLFYFFRNFGISLIKMKPATQPGIHVWSLQWKGGHFLWISFIYKGLMILAFLMMVPRKLGLYYGMRSNCMSSKGDMPGWWGGVYSVSCHYFVSPVIDRMFWNPAQYHYQI